MSEHEDWVPRRTEDGSWTLISAVHGEACHSSSGAWSEALERYARACRIRERGRLGTPVRVLDIGTGAGWNLAAALSELSDTGAWLDATTLESDPRVFVAASRTARPSPEDSPQIARAKDLQRRVLRLLRAARERGGRRIPFPPPLRGRLRLLVGDARRTLRAVPEGARFDAVFLDPFSRRRAPDLWEGPFLPAVARRMAPGSILSTYSASFAVRLALARSGLRVGKGAPFGRKREGTLASPDLSLPPLEAGVRARLAAACSGATGSESPHGVRNRSRSLD